MIYFFCNKLSIFNSSKEIIMKNENAVKAFVALGHESRLSIFKLLTTKGKEGMAAGEIAKYFEMPSATLSFHLTQMANSKLISSDDDGTDDKYLNHLFRSSKKLTNLEIDTGCNEPNIITIKDGQKTIKKKRYRRSSKRTNNRHHKNIKQVHEHRWRYIKTIPKTGSCNVLSTEIRDNW